MAPALTGFAGGGSISPPGSGFTVNDFLTQLYADELSDMFIGNRTNREEPRAKLIPLINTGMLLAYAKYNIKLATTQLMVDEDQSTYTLTENNVLSILRVINSYGRELDSSEVQILGQSLTFHCPQLIELQVEYKVMPARLSTEQPDAEVVLELPPVLIMWLRAYVAARVFMAQKTEIAIAKADHLMAQAAAFEQLYINTNTTNESTPAPTNKMCARGFA